MSIRLQDLGILDDHDSTPLLMHDLNTGMAHRGLNQLRLKAHFRECGEPSSIPVYLTEADALAWGSRRAPGDTTEALAIDYQIENELHELDVLPAACFDGLPDTIEFAPFEPLGVPQDSRSIRAEVERHTSDPFVAELATWELCGHYAVVYQADQQAIETELADQAELIEASQRSSDIVAAVLEPVEHDLAKRRRYELGSDSLSDLHSSQTETSSWKLRDVWHEAVVKGKQFTQRGLLVGAISAIGMSVQAGEDWLKPYKSADSRVDCGVSHVISNWFTGERKGCDFVQQLRAGVQVDVDQMVKNGFDSTGRRIKERAQQKSQQQANTQPSSHAVLAQEYHARGYHDVTQFGDVQHKMYHHFLERTLELPQLTPQDKIVLRGDLALERLRLGLQTDDDMEALQIKRDFNVANDVYDLNHLYGGLQQTQVGSLKIQQAAASQAPPQVVIHSVEHKDTLLKLYKDPASGTIQLITAKGKLGKGATPDWVMLSGASGETTVVELDQNGYADVEDRAIQFNDIEKVTIGTEPTHEQITPLQAKAATQQAFEELTATEPPVAIEYPNDVQLVASGNPDGTIDIWNPDSPVTAVRVPRDLVDDLVGTDSRFNLDGETLPVAFADTEATWVVRFSPTQQSHALLIPLAPQGLPPKSQDGQLPTLSINGHDMTQEKTQSRSFALER